MKYRSKISYGILIPICVLFGYLITNMVLDEIWFGLAIMVITICFIVHLYATTYYIITDNMLLIKSGFFINQKIVIETIKKISETNELTSSPALSIDRLEIAYNTFDTVLLSPNDKYGFIDELKNQNPTIEIKLKNKL
jgi:energy-coupling factor transporter transmembrane protein EcfT